MNDLEPDLRSLLVTRADALQTTRDPWPEFAAQERTHRRRRRGLQVTAGSVVAVVAVTLGAADAVPGPHRLTRSQSELGGALSLSADGPRGSLAADERWLASLRATVPGQALHGSEERVPSNARVDVVFAGDVPGGDRLALVLTQRRGPNRDRPVAVWLEGPTGATATQMRQNGWEAPPSRVETWAHGDGTGTTLVVVGPQAASVETVASVTYAADGSIQRSWSPLATEDGVAAVRLPPRLDSGTTEIRVVADGNTVFQGPPSGSVGGVEPDPAALRKAVVSAAEGTPGAELEMAENQVSQALRLSHQRLADVAVSIPLVRSYDGFTVQLVTVRLASGAVLAVAAHGSSTAMFTDATTLLPARDATRRPLMWVISQQQDAPDSTPGPSAPPLVVFAPEAKSASVVPDIGGSGREIPLDATHSAVVILPKGSASSVTSRASDGTTRSTPLLTDGTVGSVAGLLDPQTFGS